jgi:thioredoxin-related protein
MNKIKVLMFLGGWLIQQVVCAQGIEFQNISLKEAFQLARKEQKSVMVLFGTTHCGQSMQSFYALSKHKELGELVNKNYIAVAYGNKDALQAESMKEIFEKGMSPELSILEKSQEAIFTNYFVFPNFFFFNNNGSISNFRTGGGLKKKKLTRAINRGLNPNINTPFGFITYFNQGMYPKRKKSMAMLSKTMMAYHYLEVPDLIDFSNPASASIDDFVLPEQHQDDALLTIEQALALGEYYFNNFLAALIFHKIGEKEMALEHARRAINNYPKHWSNSRNLPDALMLELLSKY